MTSTMELKKVILLVMTISRRPKCAIISKISDVKFDNSKEAISDIDINNVNYTISNINIK